MNVLYSKSSVCHEEMSSSTLPEIELTCTSFPLKSPNLGYASSFLLEDTSEFASLTFAFESVAHKCAEELRAADDGRAEAEAYLQRVQASQTENMASLAMFERKVGLLTKERDSLMKVLTSFTREDPERTFYSCSCHKLPIWSIPCSNIIKGSHSILNC